MQKSAVPIVTWHPHSAQRANGWQSTLIALVRGLAALAVAAAHLRALFYPGMRTIPDPTLWFKGFAFFTGFGHQAVLLFFIVSGWLVGGSLLDKWRQPDAIAHYAVDRITRLWTVMIPLFALTLLLAFLNGQLGGGGIDYSPSNNFSAAAFIGNLLGLQDILVSTFGDNFALWSLSNETWYYVLFPLLIVLFTTQSLVTRTACALTITAIAFFVSSTLLLFFALWLLGAAGSRVAIHCGRVVRLSIALVLLSASAYCRIKGYTDDLSAASFGYDLMLGILFLVLLCSLQDAGAPSRWLTVKLDRAGRFFAEFSFTLYVIHIPLIYTFNHWSKKLWGTDQLSPANSMHFIYYLVMLGSILASAYVFYVLFEAHTHKIRRWAKRKIVGPRAVPGVPA